MMTENTGLYTQRCIDDIGILLFELTMANSEYHPFFGIKTLVDIVKYYYLYRAPDDSNDAKEKIQQDYNAKEIQTLPMNTILELQIQRITKHIVSPYKGDCIPWSVMFCKQKEFYLDLQEQTILNTIMGYDDPSHDNMEHPDPVRRAMMEKHINFLLFHGQELIEVTPTYMIYTFNYFFTTLATCIQTLIQECMSFGAATSSPLYTLAGCCENSDERCFSIKETKRRIPMLSSHPNAVTVGGYQIDIFLRNHLPLVQNRLKEELNVTFTFVRNLVDERKYIFNEYKVSWESLFFKCISFAQSKRPQNEGTCFAMVATESRLNFNKSVRD